MAKRKAPLGSSAAIHNREAAKFRHSLEHSVRSAEISISRGDCHDAFSSIESANRFVLGWYAHALGPLLLLAQPPYTKSVKHDAAALSREQNAIASMLRDLGKRFGDR